MVSKQPWACSCRIVSSLYIHIHTIFIFHSFHCYSMEFQIISWSRLYSLIITAFLRELIYNMPIWKSFLGKNKGNMDLHSWKHSLKTVTLKSTVQVLSWIEASVILLLLGRPVWHCGNGFLELSLLLETGGALSSSCTCVNGLFFVQCHVRPVVPLWLEKDWVLRLWTMHFLRLARLFYYSSSCSLTCPQRFLLQRSFFFSFLPSDS